LLTEDVVPNLDFEIIVGAANNQLSTAGVADALAAADILFVPDFLASAGGIINIAQEADGYDWTRAVKAIDQIAKTTTEVLERADVGGITPTAAAEELVAERLDEAAVNLS
jgi:glutamate dehydrogenase/leucine dehydrogenase